MRRSTLTFLTIALASSTTAFADWTQFRGPNALGVSEVSVPTSWSSTENLKWMTELPGEGSSSPIISGDAIFVTSYTGEGDGIMRHLMKIDFKSGEILWEKAVATEFTEDAARGYITEHGWASNTPVTDGESVFCYFGKAGVYAFDLDGNELWKASTGPQSSGKRWGSASSPILFGDLLIVPAGDETRAIIAFNKTTGEEAWRYESPVTEETYGTPIIVEIDGSRTDLVFAAATRWVGLNPDTGEQVWFANYNLPGNMSNTTHLSGDILTISGGFPRTARVAVKTGGVGDITDDILYDTQKPTTYMTMPVEVDGVLYWISDSGIAFAAEPGEAEELWQERVPDLKGAGGRGKPFYASPIVAGGKIYVVSRANGTFVIEPSREGLKVLSQNTFEDDETIYNATAAVSQGKLLIRSQNKLYCVGE
ncbi:MAG: PQQ-binding-like beta-propeller repeat protein [Verrucomicrobiales bacterium]|nr:PQQ-binding-like beta-propeller repeat protein [Verrucomicrobiales bacterium]